MLVSVLVILVLIYTKTGSKIMNSLGSLLGYDVLNAAGELDTSARPFWMTVIVPLGISYYTFSMVGYLADVYWRKDKAEKNFLKFLTWVLFFPKILQGPIARHKKLGAQINEGHAFDYERVCFGVQLALWGYFKKAGNCRPFVDFCKFGIWKCIWGKRQSDLCDCSNLRKYPAVLRFLRMYGHGRWILPDSWH